MKRAELEALGLSKEQIDAIMKTNGEDIEHAKAASKTELDSLKAENTTLTAQVKERDTQINTLKTSAGDNEAMKQQIEKLQADNRASQEAHEKQLHQLKIDAAVEKALGGAGAKNMKAVKALLDLEDTKLNDDGTIKGLSEQLEKLKAGEDSKFMFAEPDPNNQPPQFTGFQPGASGIIPNSKQAGYETRLAEARKTGNQLEVIKIKQEAFADGGLVLN